ncbi:glycosyltransferase family 2 protein [Algiphilus aromaticivorans]|uniref:glycosyltransferase family 2 protein n=1 Tax=Algiphilus aromaticivorans TaxID=382454 RepID=UPI0005C1C92B|nr:glycosyltransferase family 2 protein [Algiphilus aromaticivorans]
MPSAILDAHISIVIPAKNEAVGLAELVPELRDTLPAAEIIVVDDGSDDATAHVAAEAGARVLSHPYSKGNGASIKTGARAAHGELLVFMDGDGQHPASEVPKLLAQLEAGYDLVIAARSRSAQATLGRWLANSIYNRLASVFVGHPVADLTSGFRAVRAARFREFLHMLPNGFSYPTTSTMAFYRAGYSVNFLPVEIRPRKDESKSHIRLLRDGARFLLIIFRVGTLYSPLKLFMPISAVFFSSGVGYYAYTLSQMGRFTNGAGLLLITSILVFLIGLVSEQITNLLYASSQE